MKIFYWLFSFVLMLNLMSCQGSSDSSFDFIANPEAGTEGDTPASRPGGTPPLPANTLRDPSLWPFASNSPWNMPIGDGANYQDENGDCTQSLNFESERAGINSTEWSHPVYRASVSDPMVSLYLNGVEKIRINIPAVAESALPYNTDSHLHIIDPTGNYVVEMYRALKRSGGGWNVDYYVKLDLRGPGVLEGGARAYGGSAIGGLIRKGELANGIRHALAIAQPWTHLWPGGPIWPANKDDGDVENKYTGDFPMGQLAAIPASVDLEALDPPLSPQGLAIGRAMQDFGVYNVDTAGVNVVYAEPAASGELGQSHKDMPRLWELLRCVLNNSPTSVGGGGSVRRAPMAPAFIAK